MLEHTDRAGTFAEDLRDTGHVEPRDDVQEDHLGLIRRELADDAQRSIGVERFEHLVHRVVVGHLVAELFVGRHVDRAAKRAPVPVDQLVTGNRVDPRAEVGFVSFEVSDTHRGGEPCL